MALQQGDWLVVEEEGDVSWVEAELERELASLAHLTLQDLEQQEEEQLGFHGDEQFRSEVEAVDVKSLFSDYLSRLEGAQSQAAVLLSDAQETLTHVEDSVAASTAASVAPSPFGAVPDAVEEQRAVDAEKGRRSVGPEGGVNTGAEGGGNTGAEGENGTDSAVRGESSSGPLPSEGADHIEQEKGGKSRLVSHPAEIMDKERKWRSTGAESGDSSTESGRRQGLEMQAKLEDMNAQLNDLEQQKNRHQEALDSLIAEKKRLQSEHAAVLAVRAAREREARLTLLQARVRGWLVRKTCAPLLKAAREERSQRAALEPLLVLLQAYARGWLVRQAVWQSLQLLRRRRKMLCREVVCVQAHVRGLLARREYASNLQALRERQFNEKRLETTAAPLQARCRGYLVRRHCRTKLEIKRLRMEANLVNLQAHCRGYIVRNKLLQQLKEKRKLREQQSKVLPKVSSATSCMDTHTSSAIASMDTHSSSAITTSNTSSMMDNGRTLTTPHTATISNGPSSETPIRMNSHRLDTTNKISSRMAGETTASHSCSVATSPGRSADNTNTASVEGGKEAERAVSLSSALCTGCPAGSPRKNKLTVERRLQSSLKALSLSGIDTSDTRNNSGTSHTPKYCVSDLRTCSSPSLMTNMREGVAVSQSMRVTSFGHGVLADPAEGEGEGGEVAAEAQALQQVVRSREEELAKAQQARERMSTIFSAEEVQLMAERQRKRSSYQLELESACSPLLPVAWLGLVEERLDCWKQTHFHHTRDSQKRLAEDPVVIVLGGDSNAQPISRAQLLAASKRGTQLEEVVQVVLYRTRQPLSLSSFQQCPNLRTLSLTKCGLDTLNGPSAEHCPQLMELIVQSNEIKQMSLGQQDRLCFLDLSDNHLASIHGISHCPALLHLTLTGNRVARANGLSHCHKLQRLTLDSNLLINTKGLEGLSDLEYLSCCENHLPVVDGLSHSHCLQHLLLSQNNLQQVPVLVSHVLLRELNLEENSISDVSPITGAWLPLLQTLCLANNCISHISSLVCLIMLQHLDLTLNSLYDLPVLLQALRGCYNLSTLLISGNPVTQERQFHTHLIRAVPSLQQLAVDVEGGMTEIQEQDSLREEHKQQLETLTGDGSELLPPEVVVQALELRVSQCDAYHELLLQHLAQQESLEAGKWRDRLEEEQARAKARRERERLATMLLWAVVTVQARWRGLCGRRMAAARREERMRLVKMNSAATRIQAYFRGWCLRQRLYAVMGGGSEATPTRDDDEEFNYDEEIVLDFLDEEMLEVGLDDPSPDVLSPRRYGQEHGATMLFGIPGQSTSTEVSYAEWQAAYKAHAQQHDTSTTQTAPSASNSAHDSTQVSVPMVGGVMVAWDSCGSENKAEEVEGRALEGEVDVAGQEERESCSTADTGRMESKHRDIIRNEWGFTSEKTARLMWRRAQRQKHFQTASARRKKLQDPATRLAHFKKQHLAGHALSFSHTPPPMGHDHSVQSQSTNTGKVCSSPSLEELSAKEHSQYQWQHRLRVRHRAPHTKPAPSPPEHHSHSSLLPHLDPHVLAGNLPRLVSSEADKHMANHTHHSSPAVSKKS